MVERKSPVPEEIRSTPSVCDYVKVRKRVALPQHERPLTGNELRASGVRFGPEAAFRSEQSLRGDGANPFGSSF
jgi:hypothetical protein